jgi:GTP-binding protein
VFTKTDKLSQSAFDRNLEKYNKKMLERWEELPAQFRTSSVSGEGKEEILGFIDETAMNFEAPY